MKRVPDRDTLEYFEELSRYSLEPWLRRINENDLPYRWWFYWICKFYRVATAVELGVNLARTTCILAAAVTDLAIGIELTPDWRHIEHTIGAMPEEHKNKLHIVEGDSIVPRTVAAVQKLLAGRPIELLFVDTLHTVEHATAELAAYVPLLAPTALVVMDDLNQPATLWDVFHSVSGIHVELNNLHMLHGHWGPPGPSCGFGAVIVNRDGDA